MRLNIRNEAAGVHGDGGHHLATGGLTGRAAPSGSNIQSVRTGVAGLSTSLNDAL